MSHYNAPKWRTLTSVTISLHTGLSLDIIMVHYEGPLTSLNTALNRGVYLGIIMDRYKGPLTSLIIA
jgi:hypothetical protein